MFEEALLVFEAQDLNVEQYIKAAAAYQHNPRLLGCSSLSAQSQATVLSMMRKKELLPRHDWIILSRAWTELNE